MGHGIGNPDSPDYSFSVPAPVRTGFIEPVSANFRDKGDQNQKKEKVPTLLNNT